MKKKIVGDMILNIVAVALPVAMLQLIIYPKVAKVMGGDGYGLMLTIYSVWMIVSNSLGNVLNNIKLLMYPEYSDSGESGDFLILLRRWIAGSSIVVFIAIWIYAGTFTISHILLGVTVSILVLLKAYLEVGFRIKLNYIAIVLNNGLLSIGYLLGYFLFTITHIWELIFLCGYFLSTLYCAAMTHLLKEPVCKTKLYKRVRKDAYSLLIASIVANLINYADKLVLFPLMGGLAVSIYYTATILGKITGMLTGPINSVILSYITRWDESRSNIFTKVLVLGSFVVTAGYGITMLIAKPLLSILFPQWIDDVMTIIPITTLTIMLTVLTTILQPFVLKYCNINWQIVINGVGSAAYFLSAIILWRLYGLVGFSIGTVIGAVIKLIIMIVIYYSRTSAVATAGTK